MRSLLLTSNAPAIHSGSTGSAHTVIQSQSAFHPSGPNYRDWFSVAVNFAERLAKVTTMPKDAQEDLFSEWREFRAKVETDCPGIIEEIK